MTDSNNTRRDFTLTRTLVLPKFGDDANRDSTASGRGVANYLAGIAIAPDGRSAWVASTKPNSERGLLVRDDLDQDNTVRNVVAQLDLTSNALARAIDVDNSDSASALTFSLWSVSPGITAPRNATRALGPLSA